ncbi:MAG: TonB-dependent receptor, partial [Ferruginibacter sp.]
MNIQLTAIFSFLFCCVAGVQKVTAQTGAIQGRIITSDGQPAGSVTITVKDTKRATLSGADGTFILRKISIGQQVLVVSFVGLKTQETVLTVVADQTTEVNVTLQESLKKMDEVIINSNRTLNHKTLSSSKSLLGNMDLPQTVGAVSNTVISDQQATRVGDVVRNVSGVSITQTRLGVNETYTARGYSIGINGGAGSILKNGLVSNIAGMPEAATLESVEVMKGSSAMLYGNVSGGLIINLVTKKPKFEYGGEVKMQVGSNSQYKPIVDL